jgi:type II secretory pathway component PulF
MFSHQLGTLIGAGVPLLTALTVLSRQTDNKELKRIIEDVRACIEGGSSLHEALSRHPKAFSDLYTNMIRAGEAAGVLEEVLRRLADLGEHEAETKARFQQATRYPKIVITTLGVAFTVVVTFVIPRFATLFSRFGTELPLPTRLALGMGDVIHQSWHVMAGAACALVVCFYWYISTAKGRLKWDAFKVKVPVLGPIILRIIMSRFTHIFGTLYRSGLPLMRTLEIISTAIGNAFISQAVDRLRDSVREGKGLSEPLKESGVFTPMVVQMVAVGEESGKMDEVLIKVSEFYDREVEYGLKSMSAMIEPILIFFLGGVVLFLALAVFLPMWDLPQVFKR